jgi:membrane-associated phospholipid phosphatase
VGKLYYGLWAFGISISTLTLKQHYIIDVVGGFLLAFMCYFGAKWLLKDVKIQESPQEEGALDFSPEAQLAE